MEVVTWLRGGLGAKNRGWLFGSYEMVAGLVEKWGQLSKTFAVIINSPALTRSIFLAEFERFCVSRMGCY